MVDPKETFEEGEFVVFLCDMTWYLQLGLFVGLVV